MKVVHVLKRVETIDNDVKELRKLEKSIAKDKSFSTPIYMTIEKQINILLGERIKLLDLKIANPPENIAPDIEDDAPEASMPVIPEPKKETKKSKTKSSRTAKTEKPKIDLLGDDDEDIPMLTQDQIDAKFDSLKSDKQETKPKASQPEPEEIAVSDVKEEDDRGIKLLDVALERGSLNRKTAEKEKKVKFFRENFPSD